MATRCLGCVGAVGAHAYDLQRTVHPFPDLCRGNAQVFRRKGYILLHHIGNNLVIRILKHHPNRSPHIQPLLIISGINSVDVDSSPARGENGVHMLSQGGFSTAVMAQYRHKTARLNLQ